MKKLRLFAKFMTVLFVTCLLTVPLSSSASALKPDYDDDGYNRKVYYFCDSDPIIKLFPFCTVIPNITSEDDYCYDLHWDEDINEFRDDYFYGLSHDLVVLEYKRQCPDNENLWNIISMLYESDCEVLLIVAEGYLNYTMSEELKTLQRNTGFEYYVCRQDEIQGFIQRSVAEMLRRRTTIDASIIVDGRLMNWNGPNDVITDPIYLYNNNWFWRQLTEVLPDNNVLVHIPGTQQYINVVNDVCFMYVPQVGILPLPEPDPDFGNLRELLLDEYSTYENCRFAAFTYILMDTNFNTFLHDMQLNSNQTNNSEQVAKVPFDVFGLVRDYFEPDPDGVEIVADYYGYEAYEQIVHDRDIVGPIMSEIWNRV